MMSVSAAVMAALSVCDLAGCVLAVLAVGLMVANAVIVLIGIMVALAAVITDAVCILILGLAAIDTLVLAIVTDTVVVFVGKLAVVRAVSIGHAVVIILTNLIADTVLLRSMTVAAVTAMAVGESCGCKYGQQHQHCQHGAKHSLHRFHLLYFGFHL